MFGTFYRTLYGTGKRYFRGRKTEGKEEKGCVPFFPCYFHIFDFVWVAFTRPGEGDRYRFAVNHT